MQDIENVPPRPAPEPVSQPAHVVSIDTGQAEAPMFQQQDSNVHVTEMGAYHYTSSPIQKMSSNPASSAAAVPGAASAQNNGTGLPEGLKAGMEHLSGLSMDNVRVHYHSVEPARIQAHAYAQGTDIHLGPGQERHLPHEAWHVVQQAQGRVRQTFQAKGWMINDDPGLEREADVMGSRAMQVGAPANGLKHAAPAERTLAATVFRPVVQRLAVTIKGIPVDLKADNFASIEAIEALCVKVGIDPAAIKQKLAESGDAAYYQLNLLNRLTMGVARDDPNVEIATQALSDFIDGYTINWPAVDRLAEVFKQTNDALRLLNLKRNTLGSLERKMLARQTARYQKQADDIVKDHSESTLKKTYLLENMLGKVYALFDTDGMMPIGSSSDADIQKGLAAEDAVKQKIYLANAPSDDYRSGDGSYMNRLVDWINTHDPSRQATRIFDAQKMEKEHLPPGTGLTPVDYRSAFKKEGKDRTDLAKGEKVIIDQMIAEKALRPKAQHVFHLQLRFPDSGALFSRAGLLRLSQAGFQIVITVHEMKLNLKNPEWMQRSLVQLNEYLPVADKVIFLNEHDRSNAIKLVQAGSVTEYLRRRKLRKQEKHPSSAVAPDELDNIGKEVGKPSATSISGTVEDRVDTLSNFDLHRRTTVMPVFPTVEGQTVLDAEALLRRQKNILVFGLIRNNTAIRNTVELAEQIGSSEVLQGSSVIVAGKILKGTLDAIKILIEETFRLTRPESGPLKRQIDELAASPISENDFNAEVQKMIDRLTKEKISLWQKTQAAMMEINQQLSALKSEIEKLKGQRVRKPKVAQEAASVSVDSTPAVDQEALRKTLEERNATLLDLQKKQRARQKESAAVRRILPIQIHLNVSDERLAELATQCKYAYKDDEKGMADNASSIISALAQGCMVFTRVGFDTPNEFRVQKGGSESPVIMPPKKYEAATPEFVSGEMARREADPKATDNRATIVNMNRALTRRYNLDAVGLSHLRLYDELGGLQTPMLSLFSRPPSGPTGAPPQTAQPSTGSGGHLGSSDVSLSSGKSMKPSAPFGVHQGRWDAFTALLGTVPVVHEPAVLPGYARQPEAHRLSNLFVGAFSTSSASGGTLRFSADEFEVIPNAGGGDCLFHALAGKNLDIDELLHERSAVATERTRMPERSGLNASQVAVALGQTEGRLIGMVEGRHAIPNNVYAALQATPGMYAGEDELIQWCRIYNKKVTVVDRNGTLATFSAAGRVRIDYEPGRQREALLAAIASTDIALYKTPGHYERIVRVK